MALAYQIDNVDGLDAVIASLYVEKDGKYVLDLDGMPKEKDVEQVKDLSGDVKILAGTLEKVRKEKKDLESKLSGFKEIDPVKINEMKSQLQTYLDKEADLERQEAIKKGEWERLEKELIDKNSALASKHAADLEAVKVENTNKLSAMEKSLIKNMLLRDLTEAISKAKGNIDILTPHVMGSLSVKTNEDGSYSTRVVDSNGVVRTDTIGNPLSIDQLMDELKAKPAFQGEGIFEKAKTTGGSGSEGNADDNNNSTPNPWKKETLNLTEQFNILKKDKALADRLMASA